MEGSKFCQVLGLAPPPQIGAARHHSRSGTGRIYQDLVGRRQLSRSGITGKNIYIIQPQTVEGVTEHADAPVISFIGQDMPMGSHTVGQGGGLATRPCAQVDNRLSRLGIHSLHHGARGGILNDKQALLQNLWDQQRRGRRSCGDIIRQQGVRLQSRAALTGQLGQALPLLQVGTQAQPDGRRTIIPGHQGHGLLAAQTLLPAFHKPLRVAEGVRQSRGGRRRRQLAGRRLSGELPQDPVDDS